MYQVSGTDQHGKYIIDCTADKVLYFKAWLKSQRFKNIRSKRVKQF